MHTYIKVILSVLDELQLDTTTLDAASTLGPDAQLDSQEIVELRDQLNQRFKIRLPERALKKSSTLGDAAQLVAELVAAREAQPTSPTSSVSPQFEDQCQVSMVIERPLAVVYESLRQARVWAALLPHVARIEMLYDDGEYQEFIMHVESDTGLLKVRSIRRCTHNAAIDFFQPTPPPLLRHHCGGWIFRATPNGSTEVETFHRWNLKDEVARQMFDGPTPYREQVRELLLGHARFALQCWSNILSAKAA